MEQNTSLYSRTPMKLKLIESWALSWACNLLKSSRGTFTSALEIRLELKNVWKLIGNHHPDRTVSLIEDFENTLLKQNVCEPACLFYRVHFSLKVAFCFNLLDLIDSQTSLTGRCTFQMKKIYCRIPILQCFINRWQMAC